MLTDEAKGQLLSLARTRLTLSEAKYRSMSGADKIDAVLHDLERKAFLSLSEGGKLESTLEVIDREWREFAETKNREIEAAPKLRRGPMAGCSSAHYKYAFPDKVEDSKIFIRRMYTLITQPG